MLIIEKKYKNGKIEETRVEDFGEARKVLNLYSYDYYSAMDELDRKHKDAKYTIYMVVPKENGPIDSRKIVHIF